jgi:hypothetical protein
LPPSGRQAVPFQPTPELVHGVTVSHPELASVLRKSGWFSGKGFEPLPTEVGDIVVTRDVTGAAIYVESVRTTDEEN